MITMYKLILYNIKYQKKKRSIIKSEHLYYFKKTVFLNDLIQL